MVTVSPVGRSHVIPIPLHVILVLKPGSVQVLNAFSIHPMLGLRHHAVGTISERITAVGHVHQDVRIIRLMQHAASLVLAVFTPMNATCTMMSIR